MAQRCRNYAVTAAQVSMVVLYFGIDFEYAPEANDMYRLQDRVSCVGRHRANRCAMSEMWCRKPVDNSQPPLKAFVEKVQERRYEKDNFTSEWEGSQRESSSTATPNEAVN